MKALPSSVTRLTLFGLISFSLFLMGNVLSPAHSSAATPSNPGYNPNNCKVNTTEFNVVVYVRIEDYQGNTKGYSDSFQFSVDPHFTGSNTDAWNKRKVTAIRNWNDGTLENLGAGVQTFQVAMNGNGSMPRRNGNICMDTPGNPGVRMPAYAFRDGDWTCHPSFTDSYSSTYPKNVPTPVPGGAGCYPYRGENTTGADGNNGSRSLSCLELPGTAFTVNLNVASVSPNYVVNADSWTSRQPFITGGSWLVTGFDYSYDGSGLLNNTTQVAEFVYREPPPTPPTMTPQANLNNTDPSGDSAGYIEPGNAFTASGQINATGSTYGGSVNATWRVWYDTDQDFTTNTPSTNPPLLKNQTTTLTFGAAGGSQLIGSMGPTPIPNAIADTYSYICSQVVIHSVSGSPTPNISFSKSTKCLPIERRPFFQAIGGDVNASAVFPDTISGNCGAVPAGKGLIAGWNKGNLGGYAGAGTNIAAFAAQAITEFASYRPGLPPKGLTFASTGTYGGSFDEAYCLDKIIAYSANDFFVTPNSGPNTYNGNITTTGNITISHNVTTINGVFITKGKIYTCADDAGLPATSGNMKTLCNSTLTINGAFVADIVYLLRTKGSLGNGIPAEVFNYGPNVWLPAITPTSGGGPGSINLGNADSETLLPPVL